MTEDGSVASRAPTPGWGLGGRRGRGHEVLRAAQLDARRTAIAVAAAAAWRAGRAAGIPGGGAGADPHERRAHLRECAPHLPTPAALPAPPTAAWACVPLDVHMREVRNGIVPCPCETWAGSLPPSHAQPSCESGMRFNRIGHPLRISCGQNASEPWQGKASCSGGTSHLRRAELRGHMGAHVGAHVGCHMGRGAQGSCGCCWRTWG